jgi:hypothetical protein
LAIDVLGVCRSARDFAKVADQVRFLTGMLTPGGYGVVAACDPVTVAVPDRNRLPTLASQPTGGLRLACPLCEEFVAKVKGKRGFRFIKELGGAIRRETVSRTARFLEEHRLLLGRVLDYGCGFGFDADHFGWEAFDPQYRQKPPKGVFDTVVCNHVANMLTMQSRRELFQSIRGLLAPRGRAYLSVSRKIPKAGKIAMRKRIQNYVVLTLPSLYCDDDLEVYRLERDSAFEDLTQEIEDRL